MIFNQLSYKKMNGVQSLNLKVIKKIIPWLILTILVFGYLGYKIFQDSKGIHIIIGNETNETVSGLRITYNNINQDILIPSINSQMKYDINVEPKEEFSENQMKLYYVDKDRKIHEEIVVPYFEKGYRGQVFVKIKAIDSAGVITFEIKS